MVPVRLARLVAGAVLAAALLVSPGKAHAGFGIGLFVGDPLGVTLKADLERRTSLEFLLGATSYRDGRAGYGHITFLASPFVARGRSVLVPFRLGIGGALYDDGGDWGDDLNFAVRAPFQIAFQFRSAPIELYGELSLRLELLDANDNHRFLDVDGGLGFRFYF